jgi:hypothetical protein
MTATSYASEYKQVSSQNKMAAHHHVAEQHKMAVLIEEPSKIGLAWS